VTHALVHAAGLQGHGLLGEISTILGLHGHGLIGEVSTILGLHGHGLSGEMFHFPWLAGLV